MRIDEIANEYIDDDYSYIPREDRLWFALWGRRILCHCGAICEIQSTCAVCGEEPKSISSMYVENDDGNRQRRPIFMPAEGRFEDYVLLQMLHRECTKTIEPNLYSSIPEAHRPSARASAILLFWTYFEARVERLYRETAVNVPSNVLNHLLARNRDIGRRIKDLYEVVFSSTYFADLQTLGFSKSVELISKTQKARNQFVHGHPEAIDDEHVDTLVEGLVEEQLGWIAVFNHRLKESRV